VKRLGPRSRSLVVIEVHLEPQISVTLPGLVGYLTDGALVHDDANGTGYVPADDFEASFEQLPYSATRMRFFEDLRRYTTSLIPFRATSRPFRSSIPLHALVIDSLPLPEECDLVRLP